MSRPCSVASPRTCERASAAGRAARWRPATACRCGSSTPRTGTSAEFEGLDLAAPQTVRAVPGPQNDYFAEAEIEALFTTTYTVGPGSNRMGMRLEGRPIAHARGHNITSDAIAPGSIQIPGNGQPIVLLADRQTTGGYPKIATVISADVPAFGRLTIGAKLRFEAVSLEEARRQRLAWLAELDRIPRKIMSIGATDTDFAKLAGHNLISGVVDAADWAI